MENIIMNRINERLLEGAVKNLDLCRRMERYYPTPKIEFDIENVSIQANTYNIHIDSLNIDLKSIDDLRSVTHGFHI